MTTFFGALPGSLVFNTITAYYQQKHSNPRVLALTIMLRTAIATTTTGLTLLGTNKVYEKNHRENMSAFAYICLGVLTSCAAALVVVEKLPRYGLRFFAERFFNLSLALSSGTTSYCTLRAFKQL